MRAIWKGSISFGLVNIPIALYPATRKEELKFRLLRAKDLSPVNYKRVAEADGKEVPWGEIVKGYEYEKEKFIVLKDEDFQRADLEATPEKKTQGWARRLLGKTVQWLRRLFFSEQPPHQVVETTPVPDPG